MRPLASLALLVVVSACAHTAPPSTPVSTPIVASTPTAAATTAIAAASASPSPAVGSPAPCPLRVSGAGYEIYSPVRHKEGVRMDHWMEVTVTVVVKRAGAVIATKEFSGETCIDVPPGPVQVEVRTNTPVRCRVSEPDLVVPGEEMLGCGGPQPP